MAACVEKYNIVNANDREVKLRNKEVREEKGKKGRQE